MREVARSIVGKGSTKGDSERHFTRLHHKGQLASGLASSLDIKGCGMWHLPTGENLASANGRTMDLKYR
jgi:hypothetical protein